MKGLLIGLSVLASVSAFAQENYLASKLEVGTEFEIKKDIDFMFRSTGVVLQKGEALREMDGFKSSKAYCFLKADHDDYSTETGVTKTVLKGERYQVTDVHDNGSSRGRIFISLKSSAGRELVLDCQKAPTLVSKASEAIGIGVYMDNLARLRIKTVRKILDGLMEIRD